MTLPTLPTQFLAHGKGTQKPTLPRAKNANVKPTHLRLTEFDSASAYTSTKQLSQHI